MTSWSTGMPAGMHLKSDGFASNLYDPKASWTLERFCSERGLPYDHYRVPVRLQTFVEYGRAFQASCVSQLENKQVVGLSAGRDGFQLKLDDGSQFQARKVVIACGITHYKYIPPELEALGPTLCSHSGDHHDLRTFAGRKVLVVGGGASASDIAALLHEAGASVELFSRHPVQFHTPPREGGRSLWQRIRHPHLGLGPSLRSALCTLLPGVFRVLPAERRLRIVRRHLGPAAGWFIRKYFADGAIPVFEGYSVKEARADGVTALVRVARSDGTVIERQVDHVFAATGYQVNLARLAFLDPAVRERVAVTGLYPALSRNFESSVPGLYFVGTVAAGSFGPLMRFALGARYTARRLTAHLGTSAERSRATSAAQPVSP
jgi:thioredoxin reductase